MSERKSIAQPPDNNTSPRFMGIATFMRTPLVSDYSTIDIALAGAPWDGGVTNRAGARHGPREVRNMSTMVRRVHHASGIAPFELCRIGDVGDTPVNPINNTKALAGIEAFYRDLDAAGVTPLSCGGDHLITLPIMRALAQKRPVGMVHFDAHCDTGDTAFDGETLHHGTPFRRAVEEGLLDPNRTIQIGIRGARATANYDDFSRQSGMRVITIEEFYDLGVGAVIEEARRVVGDGPVYISFDVDGLDPVYASGTGTPEIGGFTTHEAQRMLRGLAGLNIVGGDVVEVAPPFDQSGNTALVGATLMFEILCVMADAIDRRRTGS